MQIISTICDIMKRDMLQASEVFDDNYPGNQFSSIVQLNDLYSVPTGTVGSSSICAE